MTETPKAPIVTSDHSRPAPAVPLRTSTSRYLLLTGIVLFIVLGIIGTLAFLKVRSIQAAMAGGGWPEPASAVVVVRAVEQDWQPVINTTGTVVATRFVTLQNEVEGTVAEMPMTSGQVVEEGQLLLRLDTSVEAAELRAAQARQALAEIRFERVQRSSAANAASANEMSEARADLDAAAAAVQQLQALIDRKTIKAPFKASLGIVDLQKGQYLPQGATITTLTGVDDNVFVDFAVPQELAGRIPAGTPIQFSRLDALDQPILATVLTDDTVLSNRTRTTRTRVQAKNTASLRPGMSVNVSLPAAMPQKVVTVPATSIRRAAWGDFVYVVTTDAEGKQRSRQLGVTLGPSLGERVIVRSGLEPGAEVVADGSFKLTENALLQIAPPATQPAAR